jgi:hypothetical protein
MDYPVLATGVYDITNAVARNYSGSQLYQIQNGCGWAAILGEISYGATVIGQE